MIRRYLLLLAVAISLACSPDAGQSPGDELAPVDGTGGTGMEMGSGGDTSAVGGASASGGTSATGGDTSASGGFGTGETEPTEPTGSFVFFEEHRRRRLWGVISERTSGGCPKPSYGACSLTQCPEGSSAPAERYVTAGTVSYESPGLGLIQAEPSEFGRYEGTWTDHFGPSFEGFLGGEEGVFRASGDEVPAFEQRLDFPIIPLLEQPTGVEGNISVSRTQDLQLTWSRGVDGMVLSLIPEQADTPFQCAFEAPEGQGVVPATVLNLMPAGGRLRLEAYARTTIEAGGYKISLFSGSYVRTPDRIYPVVIIVE